MITSFEQIYEILRSKTRKRLIAAWAVDDHTITAAYKAVELGIVDATLVGDVNMIKKVCEAEKIDPSVFTIINNENELASIAQAVLMVREGQGDILMKGLCSTDKYMRGILNKEKGLLPPKAVLSHVCVLDNPNYHKLIVLGDMAVIPLPDLNHKLIVLGDMAVIPLPDLNQKIAIVKYLVNTAKALQIEKPKVALLAATVRFPAAWATVLWPSTWPSRRKPYRSRSSSAPWPATPTVSSSPTSSPPTPSIRSTPSSARVSSRLLS